jgi:D-alanyl-D-alanine carboxypeptidase
MVLSELGWTGAGLRSAYAPLARAMLVLVAVLLALSVPADAKPRFSAIAVDARTGKVLYAKDADGLRYPASLTKMMTLYLVFQDLEAGKIKLKTKLQVSARAAAMAPSKLGFKPGGTIAVEDAIKALVTKSANDVAAAIGENLAGSESAFAARMTKTARELGMSKTVFRNASGLPDPAQVTTARDMATLGLRLQRDFPQYYPYFRTSSFVYRGKTIRTHNRLLGRYAGTDGIKTGYIGDSGYNLTTSAKRGGKRVIGVVLGAASGKARNAYMVAMLDRAFPKCKNGKTIAALAGSSKGAVEPVAAVAPKPNAKLVEQPSAMDMLVASAAAAEASSESAASTFKTVDAPAGRSNRKFWKPPWPIRRCRPICRSRSRSGRLVAYPDRRLSDQTGCPGRVEANSCGFGSQLLKNKQAFTVTVQKGNEIVYRAFSGFREIRQDRLPAAVGRKSIVSPCRLNPEAERPSPD